MFLSFLHVDSLCLKIDWFGTKLVKEYNQNSDRIVYMMTVYLENYIRMWTFFLIA